MLMVVSNLRKQRAGQRVSAPGHVNKFREQSIPREGRYSYLHVISPTMNLRRPGGSRK
jgi:hypothetical protein